MLARSSTIAGSVVLVVHIQGKLGESARLATRLQADYAQGKLKALGPGKGWPVQPLTPEP